MKLVPSILQSIVGLSLAATNALADPTPVSLATATRGGGFMLYGDNAAEVINKIDPSLIVKTQNTKGSLENIGLLEDGKFDLALVQGVAAHEAFAGIGRPAVALKVVAAIYSSPGMFVVKDGSMARAVRDLVGQPVAWGTRTSGLTLMAGYIMDGLGLDRDKDFKPTFLQKAGDGPPLVIDGKVAAFWGAGIGWPGFKRVMKSGGRFVGFTPEEVDKVTSKHTFLKSMTVPAGSYSGQKEDVNSVGVWSFILSRPDLSDEIAYKVARALHKGHDALVARLPQARETTPQNTKASADETRIHPGVLKYLREIGLL